MTRKQELYRMLLEKGILIIRSQQSQLTFCPWWRVLPWKMHKLAREGYEVAQFLHQVPYLMAHEDFTEADLWFLNIHAHSFFTRIEPKTALLYTCFLSPMKQLFRLVPENMSEELKWLGPEPPPLTQKWQAELIAELFKAIKRGGDTEALHYILALGISPDSRGDEGKTPLEVAGSLGRAEHLQVLREAGARE